jgi:hypothetical protein
MVYSFVINRYYFLLILWVLMKLYGRDSGGEVAVWQEFVCH